MDVRQEQDAADAEPYRESGSNKRLFGGKSMDCLRRGLLLLTTAHCLPLALINCGGGS